MTKKKILPSNIVKGKERSNVVEDQQIVALYFERVEDAILEIKNKYGKIFGWYFLWNIEINGGCQGM